MYVNKSKKGRLSLYTSKHFINAIIKFMVKQFSSDFLLGIYMRQIMIFLRVLSCRVIELEVISLMMTAQLFIYPFSESLQDSGVR